eukprot:g7368.t1
MKLGLAYMVTPQTWAHGWWLDGTTWVSCSSRDSNCFRVADFDSDTEHGLADLGAGHAHPVIVVENSSAASDADNGSQTVHPQPPKSSWLWNLPWGIPTRAGRVEGHDTSSPRAMVAIATSSTTANKAIVVENSSAASDADNGYQTDLPQPPKRSWLCNFPWGIPTRAGRVEGHNTSSSGAMVAIATSSTTANKLPGTREDLAYWQRFLAVVTLGMACGGLTTLYIFSIFYSSMAVWVYHGSEESYFAGFCLLALVAVYFLPIAVGKVADPTDQQVKVVQKRVEMELCRLYYEHRPQWETRQLELLRGAASPQELELAREQASAVDRRL